MDNTPNQSGKRPHIIGCGVDICENNKKIKNDESDKTLHRFITWCANEKLIMSDKVRIGKEGSCAEYGMIATKDIESGECLFEIPRRLLLNEKTSKIASILKEDADQLQSKSGWVPLLLALLHEYTSRESLWRPYVDLVPDFTQLDLPMFWSEKEREEHFKGTGVVAAVQKDISMLTDEFTCVVLPFIQKHQSWFRPECQELDLYKRMVAFIMAYSFTEPIDDSPDESFDDDDPPKTPPPMMVPMADILNAVNDNNACLEFGDEALKMVATCSMQTGDEIFNTYGQLSNMDLMHLYGYTLPHPNSNDVISLSIQSLVDYFSDMLPEMKERRCHFIKEKLIIAVEDDFLVDAEGVLTDQDLRTTLEVFFMEDDEFVDREKAHEGIHDGWAEADSDEPTFTNENLPHLQTKWKLCLSGMANSALNSYNTTLEEEQHKLAHNVWSTLTRREQYCVNLKCGQMTILHNFIKLLAM